MSATHHAWYQINASEIKLRLESSFMFISRNAAFCRQLGSRCTFRLQDAASEGECQWEWGHLTWQNAAQMLQLSLLLCLGRFAFAFAQISRT